MKRSTRPLLAALCAATLASPVAAEARRIELDVNGYLCGL